MKPGVTTLMGNMSGIGTEIHFFDRMIELYEKLKSKGPIFGFYSSIQAVYIPVDEELVKRVLIKDFNNFISRGMHYDEEDEPLTGLLKIFSDLELKFIS